MGVHGTSVNSFPRLPARQTIFQLREGHRGLFFFPFFTTRYGVAGPCGAGSEDNGTSRSITVGTSPKMIFSLTQ